MALRGKGVPIWRNTEIVSYISWRISENTDIVGHGSFEFWRTEYGKSFHPRTLGAVQKLRNGQRVEGVDDFVTYRYVYFWGGEGGILWNSYVTVDTKFENSKYPSNIFGAFMKASKVQV